MSVLSGDALVAAERELAADVARRVQEKSEAERRRPVATCGEHRHDQLHMSGVLMGVSMCLGLATDESTDQVYEHFRQGGAP